MVQVIIRLLKLEDFYNESGETIFVSTIHKAKGKEFDNVFIILENFNPSTDEAKRQLYVAMTRAKQNLTIHLNGNYLNDIIVENLQIVEDRETHLPPTQLAVHLTHKDVQLWYFESIQQKISTILSGDVLTINAEGCKDSKGNLVLKFSKKFCEFITYQEQKGYKLKEAKVNFIVYWKKEDEEKVFFHFGVGYEFYLCERPSDGTTTSGG